MCLPLSRRRNGQAVTPAPPDFDFFTLAAIAP
jgi:hypothetical protein